MIRHLFVSPDHNFYGHHGQKPGTHPSLEVSEVECVAGRGIRGDRFFDFKPDYKGQITFIAWENLLRLWDELGLPQHARDPSATRRNVVTEHLDLLGLVGKEFQIQGVRFLGTEDCRPCDWMNVVIHPDAKTTLERRGGLRARILSDGILRAGGAS